MGRLERTYWTAALDTLIVAGIVLTGAAALGWTASAEGPGTGGRAIRLEDHPAGPYLLRVVTSPTPPRIGSLFLEVRVTSAATRQVLTDVQVTAFAIPTETNEPSLEAAGTHDFAPNPVEYAAHLPVTSAGIWEIRVQVTGELGSGEASFLQRVSSSATLGVGLSLALPVAGIAALLLAFRRMQRRSPPHDEVSA